MADVKFPTYWHRFMDEFVPAWVKRQYSPRPSWKDKPFTRDDSIFFGKGVVELSELFTDERPSKIPAYFRHERFRSAYLLYFLPLQAAKFIALFNLYRPILASLPREELHVADLGAGPGTASVALLLSLMDSKLALPKKIVFHWWDTQEPILQDGKQLLQDFAETQPMLKGRIEVRLNTSSWEAAAEGTQRFDLILVGNVLNEGRSVTPSIRKTQGRWNEALELEETSSTHLPPPTDPRFELFAKLRERVGAGGILIVEPAFHGAAQTLSRIRNGLAQAHEGPGIPWWGPCLHAGACPMARGRDWCHFSIPVEIPGRWFKSFSLRLGSERHWLKYSYLWLKPLQGAKEIPAPPADTRLVLTDSLRRKGSKVAMVLLCEPDTPRRVSFPDRLKVGRGDWVRTQGNQITSFRQK